MRGLRTEPQPLACFSTVSPDGQPDVVPVAFEFDGTSFWVGANGEPVLATRKIRNVVAGRRHVALVIDDLVYMRIAPITSWSWNMTGEPAGDEWYESRRATHEGSDGRFDD